MATFSKLDKKILIISITLLVVILILGAVVYRRLTSSAVNVKNLTGGAQTEIKTK